MGKPISSSHRPLVGVAYSDAIPPLLRQNRARVDYVELPFELLRHDPQVVEVQELAPIVLHCATLSIAGTSRCPEESLGQIQHWAERTRTPWIGEHLAFITAERSQAGPVAEAYAPGEPYNIGYTVSPPMNKQSLARITANLKFYQERFSVPLLIENSPLYFSTPGSSMSQAAFIEEVCRETTTGLLLDLAHWYISSRNLKFDPFLELDRLPLERVVEIHISGVDEQASGLWDDHAHVAPAVIHRLLAQALGRAKPRAITLEYNWSSRFPADALVAELERVRTAAA